MATLEMRLGGDLERDLARFQQRVQEKVALEGVAAAAKVLYDEVKLNTSPPRMGRVTGNLHSAIYRAYSPERSKDTLKVYRISWNKSKAPHGHLLEFGSSRMAAKSFIRPAADRMAEAIRIGMAKMKQEVEGSS